MKQDGLGELFSTEELREMLGEIGENVQINRSVVIYGGKNIRIGSNVRIDCFGILTAGSAGIVIGDYVHISAYCFLVGAGGRIHVESFAGIASRSALYTTTDDFKDGHLTGPTVPGKYRKMTSGDITMKRHSLVGTGSTVMHGVTLGEGAAVGAMSLVRKNVPAFAIVGGNPMRTLGERSQRVLELEKEFLRELNPASRTCSV